MDTKRIYDAAWNWILVYGPKIAIGILILIIGEWLIRIFRRRLRDKLEHKKPRSGIMPFLQNLVIVSMHILLLLLVMQITGVQLTFFAAVIAAFGAAAGFALSGTLQNFASGVIIILLKPFKIGDRIIAQGQEGRISDIQLFYTFLKTYDNRTVIFPNSKVSNEVIVNISLEENRRFGIEIKVPLNVDVAAARRAILEAIEQDQDVIRDPKAEVSVTAIDTDGYHLQINAWITTKSFHAKQFILNEVILNAVNKSVLPHKG